MKTEIIGIAEGCGATQAILSASQTLTDGGLVVFPTETVYGVAARADDPSAVQRLRRIKSRDGDRAFTVHIGTPGDAFQFVSDMPGLAARFIRKGWPGPLTLILDIEESSSAPIMERWNGKGGSAIYHRNTVGLRCPDDAIAGAILRRVNAPVVAASANRAGEPPPRDGGDVVEAMNGLVDLLIDAGRTKYAKPSTIIRVKDRAYDVVRAGVYDEGILERLSKLRILLVCTGNTCRSPMAAALARKILADRLGCDADALDGRGIEVYSAGIAAAGGPASPGAVRAMDSRGLDLSGHQASIVEPEMIRQADYVYVMTRGHRDTLLTLVPEAGDRIHLLLNDRDVHDPIGGSDQEYEQCARLVEEGLTHRLQEVDL